MKIFYIYKFFAYPLTLLFLELHKTRVFHISKLNDNYYNAHNVLKVSKNCCYIG